MLGDLWLLRASEGKFVDAQVNAPVICRVVSEVWDLMLLWWMVMVMISRSGENGCVAVVVVVAGVRCVATASEIERWRGIWEKEEGTEVGKK